MDVIRLDASGRREGIGVRAVRREGGAMSLLVVLLRNLHDHLAAVIIGGMLRVGLGAVDVLIIAVGDEGLLLEAAVPGGLEHDAELLFGASLWDDLDAQFDILGDAIAHEERVRNLWDADGGEQSTRRLALST